MLNNSLRFEPFLRPMVWGGRALESLGKKLPTTETYGESWEVSDHPVHESRIAEGPLAGTSIRQLMTDHASDLLGASAKNHRRFPWLIKFLDARDWLSVQVHPDEKMVAKLWPGEGPKTEAWFVIDAKPGSRIYAGLLPGVGPEEFRTALDKGTVAECLASFEPKPGDCLFLPAGTVHAVGGGVLMAEIQQTSDATFRLFDWNRKDAKGQPRKLHIEEGLAAIHWHRGVVRPIRAQGKANARERLVTCAFFHLEHLEASKDLTFEGNRLRALIVLTGAGHWDTGEPINPADVWLLPAAAGSRRCAVASTLSGLLGTLP